MRRTTTRKNYDDTCLIQSCIMIGGVYARA